MKLLIRSIAFLSLFVMSGMQMQAQSESAKPAIEKSAPVELSFEVKGVCGNCKKRIENAALIKGVKYADWDKQKQMLTIVYKPDKVEPLQVHESVAAAGYDTSAVKGSDKAYEDLPGCCQYRDGIEVH